MVSSPSSLQLFGLPNANTLYFSAMSYNMRFFGIFEGLTVPEYRYIRTLDVGYSLYRAFSKYPNAALDAKLIRNFRHRSSSSAVQK
jgi:hypothetical protein